MDRRANIVRPTLGTITETRLLTLVYTSLEKMIRLSSAYIEIVMKTHPKAHKYLPPVVTDC